MLRCGRSVISCEGGIVDSGLAGKTALITGGASGIGLGIARALAAEGVHLAIAGLHPDPQAIASLRELGVRVEPIDTDVSQEERVREMVRAAITALGGVDLYVNNAGWAWHQGVTRIDTESLLKTLSTNLFACVWACRDLARHMIQRGGGSMLIVGSTAMLNPAYRESAYRISKASLPYYAEVLAIELAPYKIRVNTIIPGFYPTHLSTRSMTEQGLKAIIAEIPLRRPGAVTDIGAQAVVLLSDKLSAYTTGAQVVIDGGLHLRPLPFLSDPELQALNAPE